MAVPAHVYFVVSAIFHYLGPAFAVLLFAHVDVLGVAWLRIASAALVFTVWRRPWRHAATLDSGRRQTLVALGLVLAAMNTCFYLAIDAWARWVPSSSWARWAWRPPPRATCATWRPWRWRWLEWPC